jgi:hypothetical protein
MPVRTIQMTILCILAVSVVVKYFFPNVPADDFIFGLLGIGLFFLGYYFFVYSTQAYEGYKKSSFGLRLFYGRNGILFTSPSTVKIFGFTFMLAGIIAVLGALLWIAFG